MRKFFLLSVFVLMATAVAVALAGEIPEKVTIDACADTKTPVEFPHKAHLAVVKDCTTCHHTSEGLTLETAAKMEVASCSSCHLNPEKAETPNCADKGLKTNPFHVSCIGCHKETKAENADTKAPTKCTDCHPKAAG